ncbi:NT-type C2 domain [Dillenia turbinata]|uniref:NT-type C2 domain n=1 Tax=Dillenia turbinata TaxID=194707 RepID=A0AAN8ZJY3_9MAGN
MGFFIFLTWKRIESHKVNLQLGHFHKISCGKLDFDLVPTKESSNTKFWHFWHNSNKVIRLSAKTLEQKFDQKMFKAAIWRSKSNKIKATFKLQFQATQVQQIKGRSTLTLSLVPADVGKPTVKLEKAPVQDGTCTWEHPIYEKVKLTTMPKTNTIKEKIYYFIVSAGKSKAGFLGEVSINFADFVEVTKPFTVTLPLENSDSGALLHVTVQNVQGAVDQSYEEYAALPVDFPDKSPKNQFESSFNYWQGDMDFSKNGLFSTTLSPYTEHKTGKRVSTSSNATMLSKWDTNYAENNQNNAQCPGFGETILNEDSSSYRSPLRQNSMPPTKTIRPIVMEHQLHRRSSTSLAAGTSPGENIAGSRYSLDHNPIEETSPNDSENSILRLRNEISAMARQAEVSGLELQTLRKQIVKESKRGQDLSKQLLSLKEERDALRFECDKLKFLQSRIGEEVSNKFERNNATALLEQVREELNNEKDLNINLRLQLQKTQDSNSELILALRDLDDMLKQKDFEITSLSGKIEKKESTNGVQGEVSEHKDQDQFQQQSQEMLMKQDKTSQMHLLEQKIADLCGEIDECKKEKEMLKVNMKQLALDYELLKQENHDISSNLEQHQQQLRKQQDDRSHFLATIYELELQVERLEKEQKKQAIESSESLDSINELETQVRSLEKELEKQALEFENDLEAVTCAKIEQEQRAIQAEEALRKARRNNAIAAEQLQEDFKKLSVEMASKLKQNETMTVKALTEASELCQQKKTLEEMLQKAKQEIELAQDQYREKMKVLSSQISSKQETIDKMPLEFNDKYQKLEHEIRCEKEANNTLLNEIQVLKAEIERLTKEQVQFFDKVEETEKITDHIKQMKMWDAEVEVQMQRPKEKENMESNFYAVERKPEKSLDELKTMGNLEETETKVCILQSEIKKLTALCNEMKHSLNQEKLEKEKLRKMLLQLRNYLHKQEDEVTCIEKSLQDYVALDAKEMTLWDNGSFGIPCNYREIVSYLDKTRILKEHIEVKEAALEKSTIAFLQKENHLVHEIEEIQSRMEHLTAGDSSCKHQLHKDIIDGSNITEDAWTTIEGKHEGARLLNSKMSKALAIATQNKIITAPVKSNEEWHSNNAVEVLISDDNEGCNFAKLLAEVALLKERNKCMEIELKEMHERYSDVSLRFAEVESERQQLIMTVRNLINGRKR